MNEKSVLGLRSINSISYPAEGGTKSLQVISQRVKYINGKEVSREVVDVSLRGMESWSSYSKRQTSDGYIIDITLEENQGSYRGFDPEITQENGKSLTFSIDQAEASITWDYTFSIDRSSGSVKAMGGSIRVNITSYKRKYVNGKDSGQTEPVGLSIGYLSGYDFNSIDRSGLPNYAMFSCGENIYKYDRTEVDRFTQDESSKTADFSFSQDKATYRDEYFLDLSPNLMEWNGDESGYDYFQTCDITSTLDHYRNGRVVSSEKIPVSITVTGDHDFYWDLDPSNNTIQVYPYNNNNLDRDLYSQLLVSQEDSLGIKNYTLDLYQYRATRKKDKNNSETKKK